MFFAFGKAEELEAVQHGSHGHDGYEQNSLIVVAQTKTTTNQIVPWLERMLDRDEHDVQRRCRALRLLEHLELTE